MTLYFDLNAFADTTDSELLKRVDRRVASYYLAVPLAGEDNRVTVATAYPDNAAALRVLTLARRGVDLRPRLRWRNRARLARRLRSLAAFASPRAAMAGSKRRSGACASKRRAGSAQRSPIPTERTISGHSRSTHGGCRA